MKKFVRAFVVMAVCLMASAPACMAYGADVNNLVINDQAVEKNVYVSEDGYVMLPLRATAQLLGYEVTWNSIDSSAKLVKGPQWLKVPVDRDEYNFARMNVKLGKAPEMINYEVYVPADFFTKIVGGEVDFDGTSVVIAERNDEPATLNPVISFAQYSEKAEYGPIKMTLNWEIPSISGLGDLEFEKSVNDLLRDQILEGVDSFREQAKKDGEEMAQDDLDWNGNYQYMVGDTWIDLSNPGYMSMVMNGYFYTGGAHGMSFRTSHTFDLVNKCEVKLSDLFAEGKDYVAELEAIMNARLASNDDLKTYLLEKPYVDEKKENDFYFEDGNLVIYYSPYEIAAYAAGFVEFPISLVTLSPYLK